MGSSMRVFKCTFRCSQNDDQITTLTVGVWRDDLKTVTDQYWIWIPGTTDFSTGFGLQDMGPSNPALMTVYIWPDNWEKLLKAVSNSEDLTNARCAMLGGMSPNAEEEA